MHESVLQICTLWRRSSVGSSYLNEIVACVVCGVCGCVCVVVGGGRGEGGMPTFLHGDDKFITGLGARGDAHKLVIPPLHKREETHIPRYPETQTPP